MISLLQGSFKGVPFLFSQSSKTDGRLTVDYLYPYKEVQQVGDMGRAIPTYSLEVTVFGDDEAYFINRKRLIDAFKSPGAGTFVHPVEGSFQAQLVSYTVNERVENLGVAEFSVTIKATSLPKYPTVSDAGRSNVEDIFNSNVLLLADTFTQLWDNELIFSSEYEFYSDYVSQLADTFEASTSLTTIEPGKVTPFTKNLALLRDRPKNVTNAQTFANNVVNTYQSMTKLSSNSSDISNLNQSFFQYTFTKGLDIETNSSQKIMKNKRVLESFINGLSLVHEYLNTSNVEYQLQDSIETQSDILNTQYQHFVNTNYYEEIFYSTRQTSNAFATNLVLERTEIFNQEQLSQITKNRDYLASYLSQQVTNAKRVTTVNVQNGSMIPFIYSLYGNLDLYDTLVNLNQIATPAYLNGEIKILEGF